MYNCLNSCVITLPDARICPRAKVICEIISVMSPASLVKTAAVSANTCNVGITDLAVKPMAINLRVELITAVVSKGEWIAKSCKALTIAVACDASPKRYLNAICA